MAGSGPISENLFDAMKSVESGGDVNAVGDGGKAIGPFQIHKVYWEDAVKQDPSLKDGGQSYQSCKGVGSVEYSKRVMQAYMNKYATERRLGRSPTDEDLARMHNGGLNGHKNAATKKYWDKVEKKL